MENIVETSGCKIFCGDDIAQAAERSRLSSDLFVERTSPRLSHVSHVLKDLRNVNSRDLIPRACLVRGTERHSRSPLTIGFTGTLRLVDSCAPFILGTAEYERQTTTMAAASDADILVCDHPLANPVRRTRASIRVSTWVRQALPVADNWTSTLTQLMPGLRQELRRFLRKHRYTVALSSGTSAVRDYFRNLHAPYLSRRFGTDAVLATEAAFVTQSQHMTRLDLLHENSVVASSLLELRGSCLLIRGSSMHPDIQTLRGRADMLDYFSLLIGQLLTCNRLDFGLSRPHLEDGSFRYKAKWCSLLRSTGGLKTEIRILPQKQTDATLAFLCRNYFLQQARGRFFLRILRDEADDGDTFDRIVRVAHAAGIHDVLRTSDPREAGMVLV